MRYGNRSPPGVRRAPEPESVWQPLHEDRKIERPLPACPQALSAPLRAITASARAANGPPDARRRWVVGTSIGPRVHDDNARAARGTDVSGGDPPQFAHVRDQN